MAKRATRLTSLTARKYLPTVPATSTRWEAKATGREPRRSNKNHPFKYLARGK